MSDPQLHAIETIKVIHADGSEGVTKLRVIGIVKQPQEQPAAQQPSEP